MAIDHSPSRPLVEFFQLVPEGLPPRRADKSVSGVIPARALRYCQAITSASGFGWYVFLPINFKVVWDGHDMLWTYDGVDEWLPLTRDAVQYPGFRQHFDEHAPAEIRGFSPPFLTPSIQPGQLQIWTGCIARTAPGWSLLVRGVATSRTAKPIRPSRASSRPTSGSDRCSTIFASSRPTFRSASAVTCRFCRCSRFASSITPTNSSRTSRCATLISSLPPTGKHFIARW